MSDVLSSNSSPLSPSPVAPRKKRITTKAKLAALAADLRSRRLHPSIQRCFQIKKFPFPLRVSGVYFLCKGTKVVYIGQSKNILARIGNHIQQDEILFTSIFYIPCDEEELISLERQHLDHFLPSHNRDILTKGAKRARGIAVPEPEREHTSPRDWSPEDRLSLARWLRAQRQHKKNRQEIRRRIKRERAADCRAVNKAIREGIASPIDLSRPSPQLEGANA